MPLQIGETKLLDWKNGKPLSSSLYYRTSHSFGLAEFFSASYKLVAHFTDSETSIE